MYKDGAIYVTNEQKNTSDMTDDIVHELAHATEENYNGFIYEDGDIEREFIGKRQRLCSLLSYEGYNIPSDVCLKLEYNKKFDEFLYQEVGYEKLTNITMGLFYSPYAATSLKEYFANGFEHYFIGDRKYLSNTSPRLYNKITDIVH